MFSYLLNKQAGKRPGGARAQVYTLPAPVGGLNAQDALTAMKPDEAVTMDNIIPGLGRVYVRPGYESWATGLTGDYVETLMEYSPPTGSAALFAATPDRIFDISAAGAAGAADVTGLSNGRWQHVMFATTGGNFLCIVNGDDNYRTYDASGGWIDRGASVTGATSSEFVNVAVHNARLWFVKQGSLDAYYLPTAAVQGAATLFSFGSMCRLGGELLAIGSWTKDGGSGMDDLLVAVTSRGEVIVYQGTDPSSVDTWQRVGVFEVSEPIGRRCLIKVGGDLGILTSTGLAPLSQMIGTNRSGQGKTAITKKINGLFMQGYQQSGTAHGWQVIEFPRQSLVIVNAPINEERADAYQFVLNIDTGKWCRFTGISANCWGMFGDDLYFGGSDGVVHKFGDALSDNGGYIDFALQPAFNKLGNSSVKSFRMVRPMMLAASGYAPGIRVLTDYQGAEALGTAPAFNDPIASEWDVAEWDVDGWGVSLKKRDTWMTVRGSGRAVSILMHGSVREVSFEFNEIDIMYEVGGFL